MSAERGNQRPGSGGSSSGGGSGRGGAGRGGSGSSRGGQGGQGGYRGGQGGGQGGERRGPSRGGDDRKQSWGQRDGDDRRGGPRSDDRRPARGGDDRRSSGPRSGDDRRGPARGGDDRKQSWGQRGGDDRRNSGPRSDDRRPARGGDDRKQSWGQRDGDDRRGPARGADDRRSSGPRSDDRRPARGGDDRKQSWGQRGGDDRRGGPRSDDRRGPARGSDDRRGGQRGGDDRRGPARGGRNQGEDRPWSRDRRETTDRVERTVSQAEYDGPEIPEHITGRELDHNVMAQLKSLPDKLAQRVARHLVAAGELIDTDPETAYKHTLAARARAARLGVVREAVGETAYAAGHYAEALSELRAAKRINGRTDYLAVMADCHRALGQPDKALLLAKSPGVKNFESPARAEMTIVEAGARRDMGQLDAALRTLELSPINAKSREHWVVRLRYAYADTLEAAGKLDDALAWFHRTYAIDGEETTDAAARAAALEAQRD